MNYRMIFNLLGKVLKVEGILLLLPTLVAVIYGETCVFALGGSAIGVFLLGLLLTSLIKPKSQLFFAKEGLISVALSWIFVSVFGALPFVISGEIPSFIDALFETVSGFTTTGASIIPDVEKISKGLNFWRCFTHWIGGMGVIVFVLAFSERAQDRSMYILRAEMPGPIIGKLVPRARDTAVILYLIYIVMTVVLFVMLLLGGVNVYESACHALGTAGTGGFGIKTDSCASYSPYVQWVLGVFMLLFGVNFNLYYLILVRKFKSALKSTELQVYLAIVLVSTGLITYNIYNLFGNLPDAVRASFFQVSSIITTTGFSSANFDAWPNLSKGILFILMFIGGCAGSTAGGFKVSRVVIVFKKIVNDLKTTLHPRTKTVLRFEGKRLDEQTVNSVCSYSIIYVFAFVVIFLLLCFDGNVPQSSAIESNLSAAASCFNNIGPAFRFASMNYAGYSPFSKVVLTLAMLLGRLEIYPVLLSLNPSTWIKK